MVCFLRHCWLWLNPGSHYSPGSVSQKHRLKSGLLDQMFLLLPLAIIFHGKSANINTDLYPQQEVPSPQPLRP